MMKRLTWFMGGAAAGVVGASVTRKKVKAAAAELSPANLMHKAADRVRDAVADGKQALKAKQIELRARLTGNTGHAATLADELQDGDAVFVDGQPVEPGKVIVLRKVRERNEAAGRRRSQA
jgi:hypothetical protein